jgi:hypothetical protein
MLLQFKASILFVLPTATHSTVAQTGRHRFIGLSTNCINGGAPMNQGHLGHGPLTILSGWATMYLAQPQIVGH